MEKNINVLKNVLFIAILCFAILFLCQTKVSAKTENVNVTTIQELQKIMGGTEHSTINGTTLKIINNFTLVLTKDVYLKIPELTIDFNGKEIRIENDAHRGDIGDNNRIYLTEGKIILKDSQGNTGGFYCIGNFINVNADSELIIESGHFVGESESEYESNFLFESDGGKITVNDGKFNNDHYIFISSGEELTINGGIFEGKGRLISVRGLWDWHNKRARQSSLTVNGGKFFSDGGEVLTLNINGLPFQVTLKGGTITAKDGVCISLTDTSYNGSWTERKFFNIRWM